MRHREHWSMYGAHDPGVCACATGACTLWQAGLAERAGDVSKEAIRLGNQLGHPFSLAVAHFLAGFFAIMVGDDSAADTNAQATVAVAAEANMAWLAGIGRFLAGWVIVRQGEPGRGADQMEAGFRKLQEMKQRLYLTFLGTLLASTKLEMGRTEDALNFLEELQLLSVETHQQLFIPDLHRLRAEALYRLDPRSPRIETEYRIALQLAREQGALALELRAAGGLANLPRRERPHQRWRSAPASGVRPLHRRPDDAGSAGGQGAARCLALGGLQQRARASLTTAATMFREMG
jgi:predicted ATPase